MVSEQEGREGGLRSRVTRSTCRCIMIMSDSLGEAAVCGGAKVQTFLTIHADAGRDRLVVV